MALNTFNTENMQHKFLFVRKAVNTDNVVCFQIKHQNIKVIKFAERRMIRPKWLNSEQFGQVWTQD